MKWTLWANCSERYGLILRCREKRITQKCWPRTKRWTKTKFWPEMSTNNISWMASERNTMKRRIKDFDRKFQLAAACVLVNSCGTERMFQLKDETFEISIDISRSQLFDVVDVRSFDVNFYCCLVWYHQLEMRRIYHVGLLNVTYSLPLFIHDSYTS